MTPTCSSCGSPGRTLLLTVTVGRETRRVGTCCWREEGEVRAVMVRVERVAAQTKPATQGQRSLGLGGRL